ncbi:hypothetical protein [Vannielia litorea]|uniref:Uncharacterized protein n=1 Tax=Vannielia litorea TaxID=1217970 RepID=A0A1N6GWJ2_9RHOB|nr:hypothetical protein [Vannielia litorea]SIO11886.1 hypothetical protein SAMN05444002_2849 [Vannielia litorea]
MIGFDLSLTRLALGRTDATASPAELSGLLAWYDPSDLSTLFQDAAGTLPVTSAGDPVGLMQDKSGNGRHMSQASAVARPLYQTDGTLHWLAFNGSNASLSAAAFDWGGAQALVMLAITKLTDTSTCCVLETSANSNSHAGTLAVFAPSAQHGAGVLEFRVRGSGAGETLKSLGHPVPGAFLLTGLADLAAQTASLRVDGATTAASAAVPSGGTLGAHEIFLGRRNNSSLPFLGRFHGGVLANSLPDPATLDSLETWGSSRLGG